jgi:Fanconi anemia group J protein
LDSKKDNGAILFCVYRGKLSEGIDFKDDYCRCVFSIGIPLINLY